ncbi:hypothetical protein EST38_g930 [Candolleomyces aberdarensis]|uniref:Uncharacterized protein n=1 Tax=Candolleomyces aberdarensis TaxID=2316362 RepID=A0A4Q2DX60_9AGAR|nr:hypothetical protein EST38_g930 [Candolleomyces aberdarensis]
MSVPQSDRETRDSEDIEARQALLSEENQPASPADPTATGMGSNSRAADEARSRGDSIAGTIALASVGLLTVSTWVIIFTHNPSKLGWFAPHPLLQTLGLSLITYGQYMPVKHL